MTFDTFYDMVHKRRYVARVLAEPLYLWKNKILTAHYAYGQVVLFTWPKGVYIDDFSAYSNKEKKLNESRIGTVFQPKWDTEYISRDHAKMIWDIGSGESSKGDY